ncbi:MAG: phosphomannomutase/phosphoglucomutase [Myxococcota bacterium]
MIDPTIFRSYDIRGIVDKDLTEDAVERVGKAYGTLAQERGARVLTVGKDCRDSSPRLFSALVRGLTSTGIHVLDVGTVATPMQYFSIPALKADGGVQITGSHNPPEYNGLKLTLMGQSLYGEDIQRIGKLAQDGPWKTGQGKVDVIDIVGPYARYMIENIQLGKRKLKVVIDGGNGTAGPFAVPIFESLGMEVVPLFIEMDATFPNHHPDPTVEENLIDLRKKVLETQADFGIAFDGDGDRIGVIDEKGGILWGDQLMILFSRAVLKERPGAAIVGEVKCSKTLYDDIRAHGGQAIMWKTGHSLIKGKMKEVHAELAGEMSGHIFFKHRYFGFDDATYAGLRLAEIVSRTEAPVSTLLTGVPKMYATPELRYDCPEALKFRLVEAAIQHFKKLGHDVIDVDGARVTLKDGWGLVRASNTQPILVLRFEAETEARLKEIRSWVEGEIEKLRAGLG